MHATIVQNKSYTYHEMSATINKCLVSYLEMLGTYSYMAGVVMKLSGILPGNVRYISLPMWQAYMKLSVQNNFQVSFLEV